VRNVTPRGGLLAGLVVIVLLGFMSSPALSHHSFAMYDQTKTKIVTGKLTRYVPGANHAQLLFLLLDEEGKPVMKDGKPLQWGVEMGSAAAMSRQGVTAKAFPEGTVFTVRLYPLRDGRNFGALAGMLIHCGNALPKGGCTKDTGKRLVGEEFNAQ
jgi:uncharacterized protein DUF6152